MRFIVALAALWLCASTGFAADGTLHVGSKRFTESYILGEVLTQTAARTGPAQHRQGLGNTAIVLAALQAGSIDVYPEYLGTIDLEILKNTRASTIAEMRAQLAPLGLGVGIPLGFNNTYALAVRADQTDVARLSDLKTHPALKFGLSHEFIGRADGWPGLAARYGVTQEPRGLDHGIAYEALNARQVDVIDIYSTDAKIAQYKLRVLDDDLKYFPRYDAVLLYRLDLPQRLPAAWRALQSLEGSITNADMIAMNAAVEIDGKSFAAVAQARLAPRVAQSTARDGLRAKLFGPDLWQLTRQHLTLVALSLVLACLVGVPLGIVAAHAPRLRQPVLALVGMLQTVPSLALLAIMIPLLGMIGTVPALVALFVYALLPIVRNTCTGILQVPAGLRTAALALGLRRGVTLTHVELPLALPVILAGVKTAAVMSVGTATIAAFIGAGGYGERITIGLALNDNDMLLAGAIPAAVLALLTQGVFEMAEYMVARARR
jgi:osmoprotectant transport system permease protein